MKWKENLESEYEADVPVYVDVMKSPIRKRYPAITMKEQELLSHLSEVLILMFLCLYK